MESNLMSPAKPSLRTVAILALLVVGLACSFAFHAALSDMDVTYVASPVQPSEGPDQIADTSRQIGNLDTRLQGQSDADRQPIDHAATSGSFAGNVSPELHTAIADLEVEYVVFDDSYYRWNVSPSDETTFLSVRMASVPAESVFDNVSTPYDAAPPEIQSAIDTNTTTGWTVEQGIYRHEGTYYAVAPESDTEVAATILGGFVGYVLTPVGRGYVAVALGLLAYRYRNPLSDRVLTVRRSLVVAGLAVPVALIGTLLFESGTIDRFITGPVSALVVSSGVVAGVLVHQQRYAALVGFTGIVACLPILAGLLALGVLGGVLGGLAMLFGLMAGSVPLVYGILFGLDPN